MFMLMNSSGFLRRLIYKMEKLPNAGFTMRIAGVRKNQKKKPPGSLIQVVFSLPGSEQDREKECCRNSLIFIVMGVLLVFYRLKFMEFHSPKPG